MPTSQHQAAVIQSRGKKALPILVSTSPLRPTDILIRTHYAALNPADYICRDNGMFLLNYPAVLGCDLSGVIEAIGSGVDASEFKIGARVLASSTSFQEKKPEFGAFQEKVMVPGERVSLIPDHVSFEEAATIPLAVHTVFWGLHVIGLISSTSSWSLPQSFLTTSSSKPAILVWGASSSVGVMAVQICTFLGFSVYATASSKHHNHIKQLGAHRVFDYNDTNVVGNIVAAVKEDGATMTTGYLAIGSFSQCVDVLSKLRPSPSAPPSKLAYAGMMPLTASNLLSIARWAVFSAPKGVKAKFVVAPSDARESKALSKYIFGSWLKERLEKKEIAPASKPRIVGGLDAVDKGLDELKKGVSGEKLIIKVVSD
ncbi:hypothetical protein HK097_005323 [Rhizophlyctis rosea]|uniref:Enoyl reductase (ER) domain-containing protein n=1 Tax=Rhizophlyctis rosea TaxID=64517 RepID=A0AAD5SKV2_9FUNG|nr:hypothetical protein HK097_005323 [Rhizophlyctis rosea]